MLPSKKQIQYAEMIAKTLHIDMPDITDLKSVTHFINIYKQSFYDKKDQETYARISSKIKITDYAQELGFTLVRKGKYYSLKEHDSVMIDPEKNFFWRNSIPGEVGHAIGYGDSVIGFAKMFSGKSMKDILTDFSKRVSEDYHSNEVTPLRKQTSIKEKKTLKMPAASSNMRRVFAYLIKTRNIDPSIVQLFIQQKMLYQDIHGNCVFVGYDQGKPAFVSLRGTNTNLRFVLDAEGSDYNIGIRIVNGSVQLIAFESAIDCMSFMSILKSKNIPLSDYDYLITSGSAKMEALFAHIRLFHIQNVILAYDNDIGGKKGVNAVKTRARELGVNVSIVPCFPEQNKDWNDVIIQARQHKIPFKDIPVSLFTSIQ